MLRRYDKNHVAQDPLLYYEGLCIETAINGEDQITFSCPKSYGIVEEEYIRTQDNEYIVKEVSRDINADMVDVVAKINVEDLKGTVVETYVIETKTMLTGVELALSHMISKGWTVKQNPDQILNKQRTLRLVRTTVWNILQELISLFKYEVEIDAVNKVITINSEIGSYKGEYFMEDLNLTAIDCKSDSYDIITRIYPVGAMGIDIRSVNNGIPYVENHKYTDKVIAVYWEDNRYYYPSALKEDAIEKLEKLAYPTKSYTISVLSLGEVQVGDTVLLISKSLGVREKHRVVNMKRYPQEPGKDTATLSNKVEDLTEYMTESLSATELVRTITTTDGRIDPTKYDAGGGTGGSGGGLPKGGTRGQIIVKLSNEDGDAEWQDITLGKAIDTPLISIEEIEKLITIRASNIEDAAITSAKIAEAAITSANIADAAITHAKIAEAAVDTANIVIGSITGALIDSATINSSHIIDGAINSAKIANGSITNAKIKDGEIDSAKIKDGTITTAKIEDAAITSAKIKDGAITSAQIGEGSILEANIGIGAINSAHIQKGSINNAHIQDATITSAKIIELDAGLIRTGTLQTERLLITGESADGSIKSIVLTLNEINGTPQLSSQTIDGGSITKRTINADHIIANSITSNEIAANSITSNEIAAGAITADKIAAGSISLGQINQAAIDAILANGKEYTDQQVASFGEFLKFSPATGLTIGSNATPMKTVIDSKEIGFYSGDKKMAYMNNTEFAITKGAITDSLSFGKFIWIPQDNDNLRLYWRG